MLRTKSASTRAALVEVGEGSSGGGNEGKQVEITSANNACEKMFCFFHKREKSFDV